MAALSLIFFILLLISYAPLCPSESRKELRDKESRDVSYAQSISVFGSKTVDPRRVLQLSWQPRVFLYRGFLSGEECDHLRSLRKETLQINSGDVPDPIIAGIEERISAWTFLPRENSDSIKVRSYTSEISGKKLDYFGEQPSLISHGSLLATIILFLSNTTQGGELLFPNSEVQNIWSDCSESGSILRPIKGNAILFFTRHLNASLDQSSTHVRCPVVEGELLVATKLFYAKEAKRLNLEDESGGECSDEDESCARWAALGECKKNPVFMIGSPDYFGSCRKSCNVC